jgi:hypothetical protein
MQKKADKRKIDDTMHIMKYAQALFGNFGHNEQIEIFWTYYAQVRYHEQNMLGVTEGSGK